MRTMKRYWTLIFIVLSFSLSVFVYSQDEPATESNITGETESFNETKAEDAKAEDAKAEDAMAEDAKAEDAMAEDAKAEDVNPEDDIDKSADAKKEFYKSPLIKPSDKAVETIETGPLPEFIKQKELNLKAEFLVLQRLKIYRFKLGERLSPKEADAYLKFIRKGQLLKDIIVLGNVAQISSGSQLMRHISYEHLLRVLADVYKASQAKILDESDKDLKIPPLFYGQTGKKRKRIRFSHPFIVELTKGKESIRKKLIQSSLGGLVNPDPRVRLISTQLLRRLIPDPKTWEFVNLRIKQQKSGKTKDKKVSLDASEETVKVTPYLYMTIDKAIAKHVIFPELLKLRRFISRSIVVKEARKGGKVSSTKKLTGKNRSEVLQQREIFKFFSSPIESESYCRIPLNYFKSESEINFLIQGLKNKDNVIRKGCSSSLIRIIRTRDAEDSKKKRQARLKRKIFKSILKSEEKNRVAVGWSTGELNKLAKKTKNINNMVNLYLKKVGMIGGCPEDAEDLYDSPKDPAGFTPPPPLKDNPLTKDEYDAIYKQTDKKKPKDTKGKFEKLEKEYIFE